MAKNRKKVMPQAELLRSEQASPQAVDDCLAAKVDSTAPAPPRRFVLDDRGVVMSKWLVSMQRELRVPEKVVVASSEEDAMMAFGHLSGILAFGVPPTVKRLGPCYEDELEDVPEVELGGAG